MSLCVHVVYIYMYIHTHIHAYIWLSHPGTSAWLRQPSLCCRVLSSFLSPAALQTQASGKPSQGLAALTPRRPRDLSSLARCPPCLHGLKPSKLAWKLWAYLVRSPCSLIVDQLCCFSYPITFAFCRIASRSSPLVWNLQLSKVFHLFEFISTWPWGTWDHANRDRIANMEVS